jgi:hypothetical protein
MKCFFLLASLIVCDCSQRSFTGTEAVELVNETFDGCQSASDGGAIFVDASSTAVTLVGCIFLNCSTPPTSDSDGGAVYISSSSIVASIIACVFVECFVRDHGAGLYLIAGAAEIARCLFSGCRTTEGSGPSAWSEISGSGALLCSDNACTLASAWGNSWAILSSASCPLTQFVRANVTACRLEEHGCGVAFSTANNTVFEFVEIRENSGTNCIIFMGGSVSSFRCLSMRSNNCSRASPKNPDLSQSVFFISVSFTIADSLFAGNTAPNFIITAATVQFKNCHFDDFVLPVSGGGALATIDCMTGGAAMRVAPACATRTVAATVTGFFTQPLPFGSAGRRRVIFSSGWFVYVLLRD